MDWDLETIASISTIFFGFIETLMLVVAGVIAYRAFLSDKPVKEAEKDKLEAETRAEDMQSLRTLFDAQQKTNIDLREQILEIKEDLVEANKTSVELRSDLNDQIEARRTLERTKEEEGKAHLKERENLNIQLESLRTDLNTEQKARRKLGTEVTRLTDENNELRGQVSTLEGQVSDLEGQVAQLTTRLNASEKENERLREENDRLLKKLNGENPECKDTKE